MYAAPRGRRTISYSRARWMSAPGMSLETALRLCLENCPDVDATRLTLRNMNAELRHRRLNHDAVYLHMAAWTEGGPASIVPHDVIGDAADLDERAPDDT